MGIDARNPDLDVPLISNSNYSLRDYWLAPGNSPDHESFDTLSESRRTKGFEWVDKPHRLLYDLINECLALRQRLHELEELRR